MLKIDQRTSRAMNRRLVLNLLRREGPLSRAEIADVTGLSRATVTFVVGDLVKENYLIEQETTRGASGRRPTPVAINYDGHAAIGIKMNIDRIECILTNLSTTPILSHAIDYSNTRPETIVEASHQAIKHLIANAPEGIGPVTGIGFSMPGIIDNRNGICLKSHRFGWNNVHFAEQLFAKSRIPVWMEDDTIAFALAHHLFGLGRNVGTFIALAIGAGIGSATVADGVVLRGAHGHAGKLGHVKQHLEGPLCECGQQGCLQASYSEPAIVARWRKTKDLPAAKDRFDMLEAAKEGDAETRAILKDAGEQIGIQLAAQINTIDPEIVIAGGEATTFGPFLLDPMTETLGKYCFMQAPPILADERDNFWSPGAAALATQRLFDFEVDVAADETAV